MSVRKAILKFVAKLLGVELYDKPVEATKETSIVFKEYTVTTGELSDIRRNIMVDRLRNQVMNKFNKMVDVKDLGDGKFEAVLKIVADEQD